MRAARNDREAGRRTTRGGLAKTFGKRALREKEIAALAPFVAAGCTVAIRVVALLRAENARVDLAREARRITNQLRRSGLPGLARQLGAVLP